MPRRSVFKIETAWDSVVFDLNGGLGVKARQLLDGNLSGFPDETIRIMHAALDKAWAMLPSRYHEPTLVERARLLLASAVIDVTPRTGAQVESVARLATELFLILERDGGLS